MLVGISGVCLGISGVYLGISGLCLGISGVYWAAQEHFGSSVDIGSYLRCILSSQECIGQLGGLHGCSVHVGSYLRCILGSQVFF